MKERRGSTLTVICILSFVWIGFMTLMTLSSLIKGPLSEAEMVQNQIRILRSYEGLNQFEGAKRYVAQQIEMGDILNVNHFMLHSISMIALIIGFIGVLLMNKLRRVGYYLYLAYCLTFLLLYSFLIGSLSIGLGAVIFFAFIDMIFICLYSVQLKRMD